MRLRNATSVLKTLIKAKEKIDKMNLKYPNIYKTEIDEVGKTIIARWYATYDPIYYDRSRSLYHTYKVFLDNTDLVVDFDVSYMNDYIDRQYNVFIYENSFENGYHGGSDRGKKHPNPGIPYWRKPFNQFSQWGRPALYSFSPYKKMYYEMSKKIKEITDKRQQEYNEIIKKVKKSIYSIL